MASKVFIALLFLGMAFPVSSQVWLQQNEWNNSWEQKYSAWVASDAIQNNTFIDPKSPYYGIVADCADTAYVFRAIFSFENKLPFAIIDPHSVSSKTGKALPRSQYKLIDNQSTRFNNIVDPQKRVITYLNWIAEQIGTWNLRALDTYPIKLASVNSGDVFHYEIEKNNSPVKHTYLIKEVEKYGTLTVIYSTQAIKRNNIAYFNNVDGERPSPRGIMIKKGYEIFFKPDDLSGGYRRFRWPQHLLTELKDLPETLDVSNEQFTVAEKLSSGKKFFEHFRSLHASSQEDLESEILRKLKLVCSLASERVEIVREADEYLNKKLSRNIASQCFSYEEFDTYSTPMRDKEIVDAFSDLSEHYKHFLKKQVWLKPEAAEELKNIFANKASQNFQSAACRLQIMPDKQIDLRHVYRAAKSRRLASDPNQSLLARWGFEKAKSGNCPTFYN